MFRSFRTPTLVLGLGVLALLGHTATAAQPQPLRDALPADSLLVLGMQDLQGVWQELGDFRSEFERLGLGEALTELFGDNLFDDGELDELELDGDLGLLELLGNDAWLSLSASPYSPLPAVTALARTDIDTMVALARLVGESRASEDATAMSEGDFSFFVMDLDDPDSPFQVLAYGQSGDLAYLSTNPDTLRGVLRRLGGATEPGLASTPGFETTLGDMAPGNFYAFFDYPALAALLRPFASGMGLDGAVNRLGQTLDTLGVSAGVLRVTAEGLESEGLQRVDPDGGDPSLLALLTSAGAAPDATALAPADTLAYSSSATDLGAWWGYLNELSRSVPELGGDLNALILSFTGIDLERSLFGWMAPGLVTITTGFGDPTEPGVASSNLLGDQVFLIATADEAAASADLGELFALVSTTLAAFADPMGAALPQTESRDVGGVEVALYNVSDGITVAYAVTAGYALIATSAEAVESVLMAQASGETLAERSEAMALLGSVPESASGVSFSDNQASLGFTAGQLRSQLQLAAGLTGSADLDFAAVEQAGEAIEAFLGFVASRLGPGVGFSETTQGGSRSYAFTPVRW